MDPIPGRSRQAPPREGWHQSQTAANLLAVRKNQKLEGKLPVKAAKKTGVLFSDLVKDALTHAKSENDPVACP